MPNVILMLFAYVAFFLPIAAYCMVLAMLNRRINPLMVSGKWDAIGLLLACSGALLVCGPGIIQINFHRYSLFQNTDLEDEGHKKNEPPPGNGQDEVQPAAAVPQNPWSTWWVTVWVGYYLMVLSGAALVVLGRRDKTIVYNVDPDLFDPALARALEKCSLSFVRVGRKVLIGPREIAPVPENGEPVSTAIMMGSKETTHVRTGTTVTATNRTDEGKLAQVVVEPFASMCHVTLHWQPGSPDLRVEIEDELRRHLDECRALENPAAGWFMGISSLLFFFVIAVVVFIMLILFVPHR